MGLDCSRGAFSGAYSAFNRFRQAVAKAMGGSFPPHDDRPLDPDGEPFVPDCDTWYWGDDHGEDTHPGLAVFLLHSDCDGNISPSDCALVADEIEALLPALEPMGSGSGHVSRDGGYVKVAKRFINGCRLAAKHGEPLTFA